MKLYVPDGWLWQGCFLRRRGESINAQPYASYGRGSIRVFWRHRGKRVYLPN